MATRGELSLEIAADVGGRTSNDVTGPVNAAINRAIERYEQERFTFNVGTDSTLNSVIDQHPYTLPAAVLAIHALQFLSNGRLITLRKWGYQDHLRAVENSTSSAGEPDRFAVYGRQVFIYPAPQEVAAFTFSGILRLADIPFDDDAETNAWTNEGLALIRARAKWDLYTHRFKNAELAAVQEKETMQELASLRRDVEQMETLGQVPACEPF